MSVFPFNSRYQEILPNKIYNEGDENSFTNIATYLPGTSLLQVSSRQFSKVYDYAKDVMENGKRLISTKTKLAEVTEQRHEIHKGHQQEDENIVEQHRGPFYKSQVPRKEWLKEIPFFLYPLEDFPSFWGPNSTCDYKRILNPKHDAYIYAIQAMKRHPWRTSDPHEAKLAILPISLDHKKTGSNRLSWIKGKHHRRRGRESTSK